MAILAQDIATRMRSVLDAEGSDHYRDDVDIIPAINAAKEWLIAIINVALGQKKHVDEVFREIKSTRVFRTTVDSRLSLDVFPTPVWTILAVWPKPVTALTGQAVPAVAPDKQSQLRGDLYHISTDLRAKRLSDEEWIDNKNNPLEDGYEGDQICGDLIQYGYLNPSNYDPGASIPQNKEIEIRPRLVKELTSVVWALVPPDITVLTASLPFPVEVKQLLTDLALKHISIKQGDNTVLFSVANSQIAALVQALT